MLVALVAFMTSLIHWLSWLEEFQACKKYLPQIVTVFGTLA